MIKTDNKKDTQNKQQKLCSELKELIGSPLCFFISITSLLLIFFSFLSPCIFTSNTIFDSLDFTQTGPIGDTIGGIMNPFIALAGVLLTFIAFYIQFRANQDQRKQFNKSLEKYFIDEKINSYYKLSLLETDLIAIESDINTRIKALEECITNINQNNFGRVIFKHTPSRFYERLSNVDRLSLFKAFKTFLPKDQDYRIEFNNYYGCLDYITDIYQTITTISEVLSKQNYDAKSDICNRLSNMFIAYESYRKRDKLSEKFIIKNLDEVLDTIFEKYKELTLDELDFRKIYPLIANLSYQLNKIPSELLDKKLNIIFNESIEILKLLNLIKQRNVSFINELNMVKASTYSNKDSSYNKIKVFHEIVSNILQSTCLEELKKEY